MNAKAIAARMGSYVRGFAKATGLGPQDLGAVYLVLAVEQLEHAAKPEALTLELWQAATAAAWNRVQEEKRAVRR